MAVLYFGDPQGALALLERGVPVCGVVHGRRGGPGLRRLLPRLGAVPRWHRPDLEDPAVVGALGALHPTLLVAGFYPRRIPASVLALAPGVNVHPSDLPRWRGPDPTHWTIRAGDTRTAVCVHWLTDGLDEGDVLLREPVEVEPRESAGHLAERLETLGAQRLADVAARRSRSTGGRPPERWTAWCARRRRIPARSQVSGTSCWWSSRDARSTPEPSSRSTRARRTCGKAARTCAVAWAPTASIAFSWAGRAVGVGRWLASSSDPGCVRPVSVESMGWVCLRFVSCVYHSVRSAQTNTWDSESARRSPSSKSP